MAKRNGLLPDNREREMTKVFKKKGWRLWILRGVLRTVYYCISGNGVDDY